ncbi:MAG: cysteine--tRNA ligase [Gemmataceae bacterium]|nr:cysteine--tRNA ligase [Gemmataceae bacterium]
MLRVYNTLTKQKELFQTVEPGKVTMYVCGPTVYKPSHIGHMVGPVIFDTVKRYLVRLGYQVRWVVNITDVDDKLIRRAAELNTTVKELAEKMTTDYVENLTKLNVTGIDAMPRATEHIQGMIDIMQGLIAKGYAYAASGDVYFDVMKDADYGKLCNRDPEQLEAGARIEVSDRKRSPGDFALWKSAKPGEPAWDSPWGKGRPGWHIECSAMSMSLLGKTLDIHGGGLDLQFPHHENELAQSESFTGETFSRYWMHNGLLKIGQSKMAGSVGNVVNVVDLLQKYSPETVRFLLLATHYRSPIEYSDERLAEVQKSLEGFYRFFERYERITKKSFFAITASTNVASPSEFATLRQSFLNHMDDDFNTGGAVGVLFELLSALNRFVDVSQLESGNGKPVDVATFEQGVGYLKELTDILGLFAKQIETPQTDEKSQQILSGLMQLLIDLRAEARKAKNFSLGDQIRKRLAEIGVTLEDRPTGTIWRKE